MKDYSEEFLPLNLQISRVNKDDIFETLIEELSTKVLRLAYTYVKDEKVAEDITQETFVKCYQKWDQFRGEANIKTWIYSIAINLCKDYLKSWSFRNLIPFDFYLPNKNEKDNDQDILSYILDMSEKKALAKKVPKLPIKYSEIIILHFYEDYSISEIADILQINQSTIRTRLRRAKEKLKKIYLNERGIIENG